MLPYWYWYYNYGSHPKLDSSIASPITYTIYIYYYTGDATRTYDLTLNSGTKQSISVPLSVKNIKSISTSDGSFGSESQNISDDSTTTKWTVDGALVTMAGYASKIWDQIAQLNLFSASLGLNFVAENGDTSKYRTFTTNQTTVMTNSTSSEYNGGDNKGHIFIYNPFALLAIGAYPEGYPDNLSTSMKSFRAQLSLFRYSTLEGKRIDEGSGGKFYGGNLYNLRTIVLHELCHCLGANHSFDLNGYTGLPISGSKSFNSTLNDKFDFYNTDNRRKMPLYQGFIHPGSIQEDMINTLEFIYGVTSSTNITGTITGTNSTLNARFKDGLAIAYLLDGYLKELMYQSPIDRNGVFKFKLIVLPPSQVPYYVVITSAEFNTHYIRNQKKKDANGKIVGDEYINRPLKRNADNTFSYSVDDDESDGYAMADVVVDGVTSSGYGVFWYARKAITLAAGNISIDIDPSSGSTDGNGYSSETLAGVTEITEAIVDYGGASTFSVTSLFGKTWLCIKTHTSNGGNIGNKPKQGNKWKKYWIKCPSKYESQAVAWANHTKYHGFYSTSKDNYADKILNCKI